MLFRYDTDTEMLYIELVSGTSPEFKGELRDCA
jgi:uncharacterized protein YuzE